MGGFSLRVEPAALKRGGSIRHAKSGGSRLLAPVNRLAGLLQSMVLGEIHRGELFITVVNRLGSAWVLDQRVVAPPIALGQLMQLHFNLDHFVDSLNHGL
jgi:hypothetical protein